MYVTHSTYLICLFISLSIDIQKLMGQLENGCPVLNRGDMSGSFDNAYMFRGRRSVVRLLRDFRVPSRSIRDFRSSGILRSL